jgi:hypothetical protein
LEVLSPDALSALRKRLVDAVTTGDRAAGYVDLAVTYEAISAAGELMRDWEASGQWMHGGDVDGCDGVRS